MLKVFYLSLILGISQSLAVISNGQQDLTIKPIVHKQPSTQYLPPIQYTPELQNQQTTQQQNNRNQPTSTTQQQSVHNQYIPELQNHQTTQQQNHETTLQQSIHNRYPSELPNHQTTQQQSVPNQYTPELQNYQTAQQQSNQNQPTSTTQQQSVHNQYTSELQNYQTTQQQTTQQQNHQTSPQQSVHNQYTSELQNHQLTQQQSVPNQYTPELQNYQTNQQQNHQYTPELQNHQTTQQQNHQTTPQKSVNNQYTPQLQNHQITQQQSVNSEYHSVSTQYNGASNQYLPSLAKPEGTTTAKPKTLTQPQPTYYGPNYQYLPGTTETVPTTTPLPSVTHIQNIPPNHNTHWHPISTNVQPPIELHHGYRYVEPAQKVTSNHFQTVNGVIYNELGLGDNNTKTTQKPQTFVTQNLPSKTEIESHEGYVYGNPNNANQNITILRPVPEGTSSYNYYHPNHNFNNNGFGQQNFANHQQNTQQHSPSSQYQNNKHLNTNFDTHQLSKPVRTENHVTSTSSQHSETATISSNTRPSAQTDSSNYQPNLISNSNNIASPQIESPVTQQLASQKYYNLNQPNRISSSNSLPNLQTPSNNYNSQEYSQTSSQSLPNLQTTSNHYNSQESLQQLASQNPLKQETSQVSQQLASQNQFNQYTPNQITSSNSAANAQTVSNQYYPTVSQQSLQSNSNPTKPFYDKDSSSNNLQNIPTQSNKYDTLGSQKYTPPTYPSNTNQQNLYKDPFQTSKVPNDVNSQQHLQSLPEIRPTNSGSAVSTSQSSISSHNTPTASTQSNRFDSSAPSYIQQNLDSNSHYSNSPQLPTSTNVRPNQLTNQMPTPSYTPNQNHNLNLISTTQTDSNRYYATNQQQTNGISQSSVSSNMRPNIPTHSNNQQQFQNKPLNSDYQSTYTKPTQKPFSNIQNESNQYYYNNPQQSNKTPQTTFTSNNLPNVPTQGNRFFSNAPQQEITPSKNIGYETNNLPMTPPGSQYNPHNSLPQFSAQSPQNSYSSNHQFIPLSLTHTESPRYTPDKQLTSPPTIHQNLQYFPTKPSQVPSTNTVSNFFGEASAISTTAPVSANSNRNIIPGISQPQPNLMGNSNFLQMQSHSFELPYYNMVSSNSPPQQNNVATQQQSQKPLVFSQTPVIAPAEPARLPHLLYSAPVNSISNMYLPPSIVMQPPYYRK